MKDTASRKQALWSKLYGIAGLILMVVGFGLVMGGGRRLEYGGLWLLGIILAAAGALISESWFRKIVLWGAGGTLVAMAPGLIDGIVSGLKRTVETPEPHPIIIALSLIIGFLSQIALFGGTVAMLLDEKRTESPPLDSGAGEHPAGGPHGDPSSDHLAVESKRSDRKKRLVWGVVIAAILLLVGGGFLLMRRGGNGDEPRRSYAKGQYFGVGSTREEVLRIQGPPTYKLELVWFYEDSQVQFDSEGKVAYIWDISKNLKIRPEKRP